LRAKVSAVPTLEEVEAQIAAIYANHRAAVEDNPDSMRYNQRDQGGSTYEDYAVAERARPWIELRERLRRESRERAV
jgi:hypothetical protein